MVGVAQLVRAPDCGSGCRGFESPHSPFTASVRASQLIAFSLIKGACMVRKSRPASRSISRTVNHAANDSRQKLADAMAAIKELKPVSPKAAKLVALLLVE